MGKTVRKYFEIGLPAKDYKLLLAISKRVQLEGAAHAIAEQLLREAIRIQWDMMKDSKRKVERIGLNQHRSPV